MNLIPRLSLAILLFVEVGCTTVERSSESGYAHESTKSTQSGWKKVGQSENLHRPEPSVPTDTKQQLKLLENRLAGRRELDQYSKSLPWFKDDEEKIEFLELNGYEARQQWLGQQDFPSRAKKISAQMQDVVDAQDIAMGMPQSLVRKSWGEPKDVEVSGSESFHNERWRYQKFISSPDGYKSERKTVYFEGGKVVGWESE